MLKHKNLRNMWDLTAGQNAEFSLIRFELWLQSRRMRQRSTEEPDSTQNLIFPSLTSFPDGVKETSPHSSPHSPLFLTILPSSFSFFVGFSSFSWSLLSFAFLLLFLILYLNIPFIFLFLPTVLLFHLLHFFWSSFFYSSSVFQTSLRGSGGEIGMDNQLCNRYLLIFTFSRGLKPHINSSGALRSLHMMPAWPAHPFAPAQCHLTAIAPYSPNFIQ